MQRLVDRYLRVNALISVPLHSIQHAYHTGKSVETALHQLVVRVEKALIQQHIALGAFLDIDGAFNITCYDTMCDVRVGHGCEYIIVRRIRATLEGRMVVATLNETSEGRDIQRLPSRKSVVAAPMVPGVKLYTYQSQWKWRLHSGKR
jgi:hypothetical protein